MNNITEFTAITDRERAPSAIDPAKNRKPLPKGVAVNADRAIISEKSVALDMFDSGFPVFVIGEDGAAHILESREDEENHVGMYNVPADDMYLFLERDVIKDREQTEAEKVSEREEKAFGDISAFTGISLVQLYSLPADVKYGVISMYMTNSNITGSDDLKSRIISYIHDNAPPERKREDNPLKTVEEMVEGNYNSIDGVINNLPTESAENGERLSVMRALRELQGEDYEKRKHEAELYEEERQR
ncbi:MAG: DUF4316 domain-containing protein [Eubacterium sp.]|nr:DUF4316 domain-containing protein [Eubacterium sp.]